MYGIGWLILWALLALAGGIGIGLSIRRGKAGKFEQRSRELETELASARQELTAYRAEVADQFRETAQKFQSLNDAYTDLHVQLARSSSILCGDSGGPLLRAPQGHQDLIAGERAASGAEAMAEAETAPNIADRAAPAAAASATEDAAATETDAVATVQAHPETPPPAANGAESASYPADDAPTEPGTARPATPAER